MARRHVWNGTTSTAGTSYEKVTNGDWGKAVMFVQDEAMDDIMTSAQPSGNDPVQEPMDKEDTPSSLGSHRTTVTQ
jgi:hypothetical protein